MSAETMVCMACGQTKNWADGFPNHIEARCWACAWTGHLRDKHPRIVRAARRKAERMARLRYRREAHAEVEAALVRDQLAVAS